MAASIGVSVRVRPTTGAAGLRVHGHEIRVTCGDKFAGFDHVHGADATQLAVYLQCGLPLVDAVFEGYHACLFAYGQTGSGKTHSMLGPAGGIAGSGHLDGIIPQVASDVFRRIHRRQADAAAVLGAAHLTEYQVRVSYLEVYQERAYDLLTPGGRSKIGSQALAAAPSGDLLDALGTAVPVRSTRALMKLVAAGSRQRSTAATGQNAHSSRSHAVLTLAVEHRWAVTTSESKADECGGADSRQRFHSRTTRLTLVDLAGSESTAQAHNGVADRSGCAINLGLLALGQVCTALANPSTSRHIPYRNSLLTRLLQGALGGTCQTRMLACVSQDAASASETINTLAFAQRVGGLRTRSKKAGVVAVVPPVDPMAGDMDDSCTHMMRRAVWVETSRHGDVFARVAGRPTDPLVLYVHGSGPRNSSLQWNFLVQQLAARSQPRCYHVAIDCPGYGRSPGDRQTIRSYPGAFLSDVVSSLGKSRAYAVVGSSQGACAVMNALLEVPLLAWHVAVCHPVGHDVARYTRIRQPALLLFDGDDTGHPIDVGRRMHKALPTSYWFEFRASEQPCWLQEHMATKLLAMFADPRNRRLAPAIDSVEAQANDDGLPNLTRVAGGVRCWKRAVDREFKDYQADDSDDNRGGGGSASVPHRPQGTLWTTEFDAHTHQVVYISTATGERTTTRPVGANVLVNVAEPQHCVRGAGAGEGAGAGAATSAICTPQAALFVNDHDVAAQQLEAKSKARAEELAQRHCHACGSALVRMLDAPAAGTVGLLSGPVRLPCRHVMCQHCVGRCVVHHRNCVVCGMAFSKSAAKVDEELRLLLPVVEPTIDVETASRCTPLVVLEVGNTATGGAAAGKAHSGGKSKSAAAQARVSQTTFVRVVGRETGGQRLPSRLIRRVDFNINPSYAKPTARVSEATGKLGFTLERSLAFTYPCFATIHWCEALAIAPLHVAYYTQLDEPRRFVRIVVQMPPRQRGRTHGNAKHPAVTYDPRRGGGWVSYTGGGATASVEYNCPAERRRPHAPRVSRLSDGEEGG